MTNTKFNKTIEKIINNYSQEFLDEYGIDPMVEELANLFNTEVEKKVEDGVRGFWKWYSSCSTYMNDPVKQYLYELTLTTKEKHD